MNINKYIQIAKYDKKYKKKNGAIIQCDMR